MAPLLKGRDYSLPVNNAMLKFAQLLYPYQSTMPCLTLLSPLSLPITMAYLLIPIREFLERELQLIQFSLYNSTLYLQNIHHDESF